MPENVQMPADQNPTLNTSEAAYSGSDWKSDFDAWNSIQYIITAYGNVPQCPGNIKPLFTVAIPGWCAQAEPILGEPISKLSYTDAAKQIRP